jgi:DNA excision repair protein ERCC-4
VLVKRPNANKPSAITVESAEAFLTQKLSLLLDQKYDVLSRRHYAINARKEEEKAEQKVELDPTQHLSYFGSDQYFHGD